MYIQCLLYRGVGRACAMAAAWRAARSSSFSTEEVAASAMAVACSCQSDACSRVYNLAPGTKVKHARGRARQRTRIFLSTS